MAYLRWIREILVGQYTIEGVARDQQLLRNCSQRCGNKDRCRKCKGGEKHGPYLYRYFYKDGKQRSEYIKLSDLPKHPEAPPQPV